MASRTSSDDLLRRRFRALARTLPRALEGDADAVHKARVASRRIRETIPVALAAARAGKRRKLRERLAAVTRALGPVRELDVSRGLLDELAKGERPLASALDPLRLELEAERRARHDRMAAKLDGVDIRRLHARAERLLRTAAQATDPSDLPGVVVLLLRLTRRVEELDEAVRAAGPLYAAEPIHRVRIAVKKVRYAFEVAGDIGLLGSRRVLPRLRAMQETLGRLHDLQVLAIRVDSLRARLGPSEHVETLDTLAARLEAECRELHARFVTRRDKLVSAADDALAEVAARASTLQEGSAARTAVH